MPCAGSARAEPSGATSAFSGLRWLVAAARSGARACLPSSNFRGQALSASAASSIPAARASLRSSTRFFVRAGAAASPRKRCPASSPAQTACTGFPSSLRQPLQRTSPRTRCCSRLARAEQNCAPTQTVRKRNCSTDMLRILTVLPNSVGLPAGGLEQVRPLLEAHQTLRDDADRVPPAGAEGAGCSCGR